MFLVLCIIILTFWKSLNLTDNLSQKTDISSNYVLTLDGEISWFFQKLSLYCWLLFVELPLFLWITTIMSGFRGKLDFFVPIWSCNFVIALLNLIKFEEIIWKQVLISRQDWNFGIMHRDTHTHSASYISLHPQILHSNEWVAHEVWFSEERMGSF